MGEPIVVVLFQRGAFDGRAAHETARALFWQGGAIWTVAAVRQTVPAFYALGDTRTPVIVSAVDLAAFVALAVGLRGLAMGHVGDQRRGWRGRAPGRMALLLVGLRVRMGTLRGRAILRSAARTVAASIVAGVAACAAARLVSTPGRAGHWGRGLPGLFGTVLFIAVFWIGAWVMRSPELEEIFGTIRRRMRRGRAAA